MPIRITNIAHPPQYITLPAPYQGILRSGAVEVIDTTEAEFLTKMGGSNVSLGALTIETVAAAATIEVDRTVTDADLITNVDNSLPGYAYTQNILVDSTSGTTIVNMTGVGGAELEEGVIYTIKDAGGTSSTANITVQHPSYTFDGAAPYIIETDYASVGFYRSGSSFVPLPGVSSGGASTLGGLTNVPAAADTLGAGDDQEVLVWDGTGLAWTVGPLDKRNRVQAIDFEEVPAGNPPSGPFVSTSPHQLPTGYDVFAMDTGANQGAVTVKLPTIASATSLLGSSRSTRLYLKVKGNAASYAVTVEPSTSDVGATIDGASSKVLGTNWQSITLVVSGTDWLIL